MDGSSEGRGGSRSGSRSGGGGGGRRSSSNNGENSEKRRLSSLGTTLRRQGDAMAQKVVTLQKSDVGIVTVLRKVEAGLQALSTKDLFWKVRQHRGGGEPLRTCKHCKPKKRGCKNFVPGGWRKPLGCTQNEG